MAISPEDKKDVKRNFGKALANKVADATRDHSGKLQKNQAKKYFYDGGVKKFGKEKTIESMKQAFGSRKTRAGNKKMSAIDKKFNERVGELEFQRERQGNPAHSVKSKRPKNSYLRGDY